MCCLFYRPASFADPPAWWMPYRSSSIIDYSIIENAWYTLVHTTLALQRYPVYSSLNTTPRSWFQRLIQAYLMMTRHEYLKSWARSVAGFLLTRQWFGTVSTNWATCYQPNSIHQVQVPMRSHWLLGGVHVRWECELILSSLSIVAGNLYDLRTTHAGLIHWSDLPIHPQESYAGLQNMRTTWSNYELHVWEMVHISEFASWSLTPRLTDIPWHWSVCKNSGFGEKYHTWGSH